MGEHSVVPFAMKRITLNVYCSKLRIGDLDACCIGIFIQCSLDAQALDCGRIKPVPVYFIGVGEKLEDLETFNAR